VLLIVLAALVCLKKRVGIYVLVTPLITLFGIWLAHKLFAVPYPADRTWLYMPIFWVLLWAVGSDLLRPGVLRLIWCIPLLAIAGALIVQVKTDRFITWQFDAKTHRVIQEIAKITNDQPAGSVRVATSWLNQNAIEFYRVSMRLEQFQPVERTEPVPLKGYDFYVLQGEDRKNGLAAGLRFLYEDADARIALATNPERH
jgi:hypothetical protein